MCDIKPIGEILRLSDEDYKEYVMNLLDKEDSIHLISELDDEFLNIVEAHPHDVARLCRLNSVLFSHSKEKDVKNHNLAFNYNTLMVSNILRNDIEQSKSVFLEGLEFCRINTQYAAGKSLCRNILKLFNSSQIPLDEILKYFSQITMFYLALEKYKDAIDTLCAAAMHFADVSAFQSAYRAINDAQDIVIDNKISSKQIKILETQGTVALYEGDLDCADTEFTKCFRLYKMKGETPPFYLKANAALVKLRKRDFKSAKNIYKGLLKKAQKQGDQALCSQIMANLLICYRELEDIKAIKSLLPQIENMLSLQNPEQRIETRLNLSKTYYYLKDTSEGTSHLKSTCIAIQELLDKYQRIHYRRGIRERFMPRIRPLLLNCMESGPADDILPVLFFCSSNSLLDWFSLLEWVDLVLKSEEVTDKLKNELLIKKETLLKSGTPFMYGFDEKYDSPFEFEGMGNLLDQEVIDRLDSSRPWREFNNITAQICQLYSFPKPFEGASVQSGVSLLERHQLNGTAFLFALTVKEGSILILVAKGNYIKITIPENSTWAFNRALYEYQRNPGSRKDFWAFLSKLKSEMAKEMRKITDVLEETAIQELVYVSDQFTEGFPILSILLESEIIGEKIKNLRFTYRACPALKESLALPLKLDKGVFIWNSDEDLELANPEIFIIKKLFKTIESADVDLRSQEADFSESPLNSAHFLHMTTHSFPANVFTDPLFVSTSTDIKKNGIWLESIQRDSDKLELSLVVLNGCNTGATSNKNYFKPFMTDEKVGLSSAFILNRKCIVISTQWNEPEIVGFVFSSLFYKRLSDHLDPVRAYILTLSDLYDLTKEKTIEIMGEIPDDNARRKRCDSIKISPAPYPFRDAYFSGMFQCNSLLKPLEKL